MKRLFTLQRSRPDRAVHGYFYYRWTDRYMAAARWVLDRPGLGWIRRRAGLWLERTHHAKVVPASDARRIITLDHPIEWRGLERVVPFAQARDIVLDASPTIALAPCACRAVARDRGEYDGSCGEIASCLYLGDPIASFVAEKQSGARRITSEEALRVVENAAARGNVHTLWFKDAAGGRMYAVCNCCSCCCIGMRAERAGFSPLAGSGYLAAVTEAGCTACGACVQACPFSAIELSGDVVRVDSNACMGCGVCVGTCPHGALALEPGGAVDPLPDTQPPSGPHA